MRRTPHIEHPNGDEVGIFFLIPLVWAGAKAAAKTAKTAREARKAAEALKKQQKAVVKETKAAAPAATQGFGGRMRRDRRQLANPAIISTPLALVAPTLMTNPEDPSDPTQPLYAAGLDSDGVGYFGLKLTHAQRVRAAEDKLIRLHRRIVKLEGKLADEEDKYEMLTGESVDDFYEEVGIPTESDTLPVPVHTRPPRH